MGGNSEDDQTALHDDDQSFLILMCFNDNCTQKGQNCMQFWPF